MKRKKRLYLDTSVISYLDQQDVQDKMNETRELWEILKTNQYEVVISNIAMLELSECSKQKQCKLKAYIDEITYEEYSLDIETEELARIIINEGILKPKSKDDAYHIASAILSNCDIILSWNFKHLVNVNTINGVRKICFNNGITRIIDIYSPNILLERRSNENE